jgi:hypothetical protein
LLEVAGVSIVVGEASALPRGAGAVVVTWIVEDVPLLSVVFKLRFAFMRSVTATEPWSARAAGVEDDSAGVP